MLPWTKKKKKKIWFSEEKQQLEKTIEDLAEETLSLVGDLQEVQAAMKQMAQEKQEYMACSQENEAKILDLEKENRLLQEALDHCRENLLVSIQDARKLQTMFEQAENNEVTLRVSDSIESVTPIIRYKTNVFENLVKEGYLQDSQLGNPMAIQLALLTIASDALGQILDSYQQVPES